MIFLLRKTGQNTKVSSFILLFLSRKTKKEDAPSSPVLADNERY